LAWNETQASGMRDLGYGTACYTVLLRLNLSLRSAFVRNIRSKENVHEIITRNGPPRVLNVSEVKT
jgi:hypothetical protein